MKKTWKQIAAGVLAAAMLASALPMPAFAEVPATTPKTEAAERVQEALLESATPENAAAEQTAYDKVVTLFAALPAANVITSKTADAEKEALYRQLGEAMAAYDALSEDEQAKFEEEHADSLAAAMALNDAITGNTAVALATPAIVTSAAQLDAALADSTVTQIKIGKSFSYDKSITRADIEIVVQSGFTFTYTYSIDASGVNTVCKANITVENGGKLSFKAASTSANLIITGNFSVKAGGSTETFLNNYYGKIFFKGNFSNAGTVDAANNYIVLPYGISDADKGTITGNRLYINLCIGELTKTSIDDPYVYLTEIKGNPAVGETLSVVVDGFGEVSEDNVFGIRWGYGTGTSPTEYTSYQYKAHYTVQAADAGKPVRAWLNGVKADYKSNYRFFVVDIENGKVAEALNSGTPLAKALSTDTIPLMDVVYLSANNGADTNAGTAADKAVKTFATAMSLVKNGGTIVVTDAVTVPSGTYYYMLSKNVTFTGKYNDVTYPDAQLVNKAGYFVQKGVTFKDIALATTGTSAYRGYIFCAGNGIVVNMDNVTIPSGSKSNFSSNDNPNAQLNVKNCDGLRLSAAAGLTGTVTLDNSSVASTFGNGTENAIGSVVLKNNSTLVTTQPITNLTGDGTNNALCPLYVDGKASYPGTISVSGAVTQSSPIRLKVVDEGLNKVTPIPGQALLASTADSNLKTADFTLNSADYPGFSLNKVGNNICAAAAVSIEGVTVSDKEYDGTAISYAGTAAAKLSGTEVTIEAADYLYTWCKADGTALTAAPTDAGSYKLLISIADRNTSYTGTAEIPFEIKKADVSIPTATKNLIYTGSEQTGVAAPQTGYTVTDGKKTDAGDYTATATLTDATNYQWADATTAPKTIVWSIAKKSLTWDASGLKAEKVYDGSNTATVTGTLKVSGAAGSDDVGFTYTGLTANYDKATDGDRTVTATVTGAAITNKNYALPTSNSFTFMGKITPKPVPPTPTPALTQTPAATQAPTAAPGKFTVNAWVDTLAGGTVSAMGSTAYAQGASITYTITPAAGYRIAKVTVDGVDVGAVSSYTFSGMNRSHEIGAYFEKATTAKVSSIPATGDEAPVMPWVVLMAVGATGLAGAFALRRKKNH